MLDTITMDTPKITVLIEIWMNNPKAPKPRSRLRGFFVTKFLDRVGLRSRFANFGLENKKNRQK